LRDRARNCSQAPQFFFRVRNAAHAHLDRVFGAPERIDAPWRTRGANTRARTVAERQGFVDERVRVPQDLAPMPSDCEGPERDFPRRERQRYSVKRSSLAIHGAISAETTPSI
jgi:hypothetical protein